MAFSTEGFSIVGTFWFQLASEGIIQMQLNLFFGSERKQDAFKNRANRGKEEHLI